MDTFEFAFSLFGLVLGLSVTEVVSGFARVLHARAAVRLGWLTPLLGLLLFVDLVTFWTGAWYLRGSIPIGFMSLLLGTTIASIYFLSATLVFPARPEEWPDLDDFFLEHKGQVMGGVIAANLLMQFYGLVLRGVGDEWPVQLTVAVVYTSLGTALIVTRKKWLCGAILGILLSLYAVFNLF